jgi:hypothetical protein
MEKDLLFSPRLSLVLFAGGQEESQAWPFLEGTFAITGEEARL